MVDKKDEVQEIKKQNLIPVRVVISNDTTSLVEWSDGELKRGFVATKAIQQTKIAEDDLEAATPYGEDWTKLIKITANTDIPKRLAELLYKNGIWQAVDILENPGAVQACIQEATGLILADIIRVANKIVNKEVLDD